MPWRFFTALALALLVIGLPGASGAHAASANWAWMIVRQTGDHTPRARDRGNSSGAVDTVTDLSGLFGPGTYGITFNDVGPEVDEHGSVLVSTLGTGPLICTPHDWTTTNDDVSVTVACFTRAGNPASATFVVNWLAASGTGGRLAYAANFSPSGKTSPASRQYHSQGEVIISSDGSGIARLTLGGLGSEGGHVQLSALTRPLGAGDAATAGTCSVAALRDSSIDAICFVPGGGTQLGRGHTMWFMNGLGLKGIVRHRVAYLYANRPKRASYRPPPRFRYASNAKVARIERLGKGRYRVTLPGMPVRGSAQVTPFAAKDGAGAWIPRHCVIASIASKLPQTIGVRCFDASGDLADSRFMLSWAK